MGLKEMLAAKKAAAEAEQAKIDAQNVETITLKVAQDVAEAVAADPQGAVEFLKQEIVILGKDNGNQTNPPVVQRDAEHVAAKQAPVSPLDLSAPEQTAATEASPAEQKPLSFAEKMALKKQQIAAAQKQEPPKAPAEVIIDPASIPEDPLDAQAYVDIKTRITRLEDMMEDDLKPAMSELKAALKKNPNAALLMLDTDVGKMVSALRRITHVAQVEAAEGKKPGRKPKAADVKLSAEQIAAAFEEL